MDAFKPIKLSKNYIAATRRQFTFYHSTPTTSWYLFNQPHKKG